MLALNGPPVFVPATALVRLHVNTLFLQMNELHRTHLLGEDLQEDVTVQPINAVGTDRSVDVQKSQKTLLTLSLNTGPATLPFCQTQIDTLRAQKCNRDARLAEIVLQQTYIPSFLALTVRTPPDTRRWLLTLLEAVQQVAIRVATEIIKALFEMPRPKLLAAGITPVIQTSVHSAFPSSHATETFGAATVLGAFYPSRLANWIAARIAVNRGFAGVHYPVDHLADTVLGHILSNVVVERVSGVAMLAKAQILPPVIMAGTAVNGFKWSDLEG